MEVRGRDMISGLPRKTMISSEEVREALKEPVGAIIDCVTRTLEKAEPELAADLVGFHVRSYAWNFFDCVESVLECRG